MDINVLHEEAGLMTGAGDSGVGFGLSFDPALLKVVQAGEVTIMAFGEQGARDTTCIVTYHNKLVELIDQHKCRSLIFDMRGVWFLPSKVLGALLSLRKLVDRIELQNLSDDVREVLHVTQLDQAFHIDEAN